MKITIRQGDIVAPQPTFRWEQVAQREGVYREWNGSDHLRYVTCRVSDTLKTAVVNLATNLISKPYGYNHLVKYVEAEPLIITFSND